MKKFIIIAISVFLAVALFVACRTFRLDKLEGLEISNKSEVTVNELDI